jgi:hypothetical protein
MSSDCTILVGKALRSPATLVMGEIVGPRRMPKIV